MSQCSPLSNHDENIKRINSIIERIGEVNFISALNEINRRFDEAKKVNCETVRVPQESNNDNTNEEYADPRYFGHLKQNWLEMYEEEKAVDDKQNG
jgi:hypothetical protein